MISTIRNVGDTLCVDVTHISGSETNTSIAGRDQVTLRALVIF